MTTPADLVLSRLHAVHPSGDGWTARCPAHADDSPSLSVGLGEDGRVLLRCHAGCALDAIVRALDLTQRDLFPVDGRRLVAAHDYRDERGTLLRQVLRFDPKGFAQRRPDGAGGWISNVAGVRPTLYRLDELRGKAAVVIVEGEKDVERLRALGWAATTSPGGAGSPWLNAYTEQLQEAGARQVAVIPDQDAPGRQHAEMIADALVRTGLRVKLLALPDLPEHGDVSDWLDAGHTKAELTDLAKLTPDWTPREAVPTAPPASASSDEPAPDDALHDEPQTDVGNARRLVARHGASLRYASAPRGEWFVWDGTRWCPDTTGAVVRLAKETIRTHLRAAIDASTPDRDSRVKHWLRSESSSRIFSMVEMAKSEPAVIVPPTQFDQDEWFLNVENGTLDLRTGTLRAPDRADWITKRAPVRFDAEAACPRWMQFLDQILVDPDLIGYVQRVLGYCLTGSTREQKLWVLHGHGQNGKSTLIETVRTILGEDQYAASTPPNTLLVKTTDSIPSDVAKLVGARFVTAVETERGKFLAESLVKAMTGGDRVNARKMYADWFSFQPTFKLLMATNHKPKIKGTDDGIWRRIHSIPFSVRVPDADVDPNLPETLRGEASGILNWMLAGCLDWQKHGLRAPASVIEATRSYRLSQDVLGKFLDEAVDQSLSEARCSPRTLYSGYQRWAEAAGERPATERDFAEALEEKGFERRRSNSERYWRGLRLLPEFAAGLTVTSDSR